ncbi:peptidase inhibitor family I36 protein [Streptomyces sp. NPDC059568]|uniref:peptidase inhibitor family I36 protein n=1 Tax=Streptomyces sp. NPDC059568 TaxID=3346868 RepID=UPI0036C2A218
MKHSKIAAAALFGAAMLIGGTNVAMAAPAGCESGWVCMYRDDDYAGGAVNLTNNTTAIPNLGSNGFNDEMNSWFSNFQYDSAWYYDANYGGSRKCMNSNSSNHSLGLADYDEATSARKLTTTTSC